MADPVRSGDNLLCRCFRVPESVVRQAIREKALTTVEAVTAYTNAAGGCSSCYDDIQAILDGVAGTSRHAVAASTLSDAQKDAAVRKTFEEDVRKLYEINDVAARILDVRGDRVETFFSGRAAGNDLPSILTLKWYLVKMMTTACGQKMQQIETNVLQPPGARAAS